MVQEQVVVDDDDDDEIEPLFSYKRVCRPPSDADSDEDVTIFDSKKAWQSSGKRGVDHRPILPTHASGKGELDNITKEVDDDDDWLPPPPKSAKVLMESRINEDPTVLELRQEREELRRFAATTEARLRNLEEGMKAQKSGSQPHETIDVSDEPVCAVGKREKVLIAIQNKDGTHKNFKVYKDEKFEKLFVKYAESIGVAFQQLVFLFDGEKVLGDNTPKDMGIEDEDIVEVNLRK